MKLYLYEHCPFCCRALMAAGFKAIPLELEVVMEGDAETPLRLTGRKGLPILQRDDGSCMAESMDIVHYLDALQPPLDFSGPADPQVEDWCLRAWEPSLRLFIPRFTQADFRELSTPEAREAYLKREIQAFGDMQVLLDETPSLLRTLQILLQELETIAPAGEVLSISDFRLYPILRSLTIVHGVNFGPRVQAYLDAVSVRCGLTDFSGRAR